MSANALVIAPVAAREAARMPRAIAVDDRDRWNALLSSRADAALEQGYEWGEVLRDSGAGVHRLAVAQEGRLAAAVAMLGWGAPIIGSVLYAPRGPVVGEASAWPPLIEAIAGVARTTRAAFLRVSPPATASPHCLHEALLRQGFLHLPDEWAVWNCPRIVMTLGLDGDDDAVWRRISNTRRREIRVAARAFTLDEVGAAADLRSFYRLLLRMGRDKRYPVRRPRFFEALWREYRRAGTGLLVLARHGGDVVGGLLAARFGRSAYFLYSAVDRARGAAAGAPAGPLLYWHFIRWARAAGCDMIHWGGSGTKLPPDPSDSGYGLYQFKRSFGATLVACPGYYDLVFRPVTYRVARLVEQRLGPRLWSLRARLNR